MIAKTFKIPQVAVIKLNIFYSISILLVALMASCSKSTPIASKLEKKHAPTLETIIAPQTPVAIDLLDEESAQNMPWESDPMGSWTMADSLDDFHDTWTAYCAQSALGPPAPDTLLPYADAVAHAGESWGLATAVPELILFDTSGHAYRYPEGRHGLVPKEEKRILLGPSEREELGLKDLPAGQTLRLLYQGSALQMVGALRANESCSGCHEGNDTLLGGYKYSFHEIPDD